MIRKLLLVRKKHMRVDLMEKAELKPYIQGEPLPIRPIVWNDEAGMSHYGFVLGEMKLKDLEKLRNWASRNLDATVLDLADDKPESVLQALAGVGLQVNESA